MTQNSHTAAVAVAESQSVRLAQWQWASGPIPPREWERQGAARFYNTAECRGNRSRQREVAGLATFHRAGGQGEAGRLPPPRSVASALCSVVETQDPQFRHLGAGNPKLNHTHVRISKYILCWKWNYWNWKLGSVESGGHRRRRARLPPSLPHSLPVGKATKQLLVLPPAGGGLQQAPPVLVPVHSKGVLAHVQKSFMPQRPSQRMI